MTWKKMEKVFETQEELTGYITGRVKGGFICTIDGLPTFMPASQIDVKPLKKFDHLMNTPLKVIATRIDRSRGNVCTSSRAVLEKSKNDEISEALKNINEGDFLVICSTGAYGSVQSSNYNTRASIDELLINNGEYEIIRKRIDEDTIINKDIISKWV